MFACCPFKCFMTWHFHFFLPPADGPFTGFSFHFHIRYVTKQILFLETKIITSVFSFFIFVYDDNDDEKNVLNQSQKGA